jgi:hypothetical protein
MREEDLFGARNASWHGSVFLVLRRLRRGEKVRIEWKRGKMKKKKSRIIFKSYLQRCSAGHERAIEESHPFVCSHVWILPP